MSSKAQRIRELLAQGLSTRDVAEQVGCDPAYVRVAGRQRKDGVMSKAQMNWINKNYGSVAEYARVVYAKNPEYYRAYSRAYSKNRYHADPEWRAAKIARVAAYQRKRRATDPAFRKRINVARALRRKRARTEQLADAANQL